MSSTLDLSSFRHRPNRPTRRAPLDMAARVAHPKKDLAQCNMYYPLTAPERAAFRTKAGKRVTEHQWAVYDLVRNIPAGQVSTYKDICVALGSGSPRSVGGALRNNPFAPYVPCHRIVASNLFIGGFFGEWTDLKQSSSKDAQVPENWHEEYKGKGTGAVQREKIRMLAMEGVLFDKSGKLIGSEEFTWKG